MINTDENVEKVVGRFGADAFENLKIVMEDILTGQDLEHSLRFIDPATLQARLKKKSILTLEIYSVSADRWYRQSFIGGEKKENGEYSDVVFCYGDITEDKLREIENTARVREYRDQMYRDSLTDLYNRKYLDEHLLNRRVMAVVMADIDRFKEVNDTMGHHCGDQAIATAARILRSNVRMSDSVVRYGGDEFTIVFDNIPLDVLDRKLEDMRAQIQDVVLEDYPDMKMTMSFGACIGAGRVYDLLRYADKALYESKQVRNKVTIHQ